jgi:2-oxoglutarate ferredoxin oxidoreductase subunit delta
MGNVTVDLTKCTGCGTCVQTCPVGVYELKNIGGSEKSQPVNKDQCILCRACEVSCPESAITITE